MPLSPMAAASLSTTARCMQSETPNQIIGVLAHETGHLAGGHLAKMREQMARAQTQMIIAMLLGAGAMVAGSRTGNANSGLANAGAAAIAGPQEMIRRTMISYVRQQEENADRAGRQVSDRKRPIPAGDVRDLQAVYQRQLVCRSWCGPLPAVASDACGARGRTRGIGALQSLLGQERRSGAAISPRHDAGQNLRVHGATGHRVPALSDVERQLALALCARDRRPTCMAICAPRLPRSMR